MYNIDSRTLTKRKKRRNLKMTLKLYRKSRKFRKKTKTLKFCSSSMGTSPTTTTTWRPCCSMKRTCRLRGGTVERPTLAWTRQFRLRPRRIPRPDGIQIRRQKNPRNWSTASDGAAPAAAAAAPATAATTTTNSSPAKKSWPDEKTNLRARAASWTTATTITTTTTTTTRLPLTLSSRTRVRRAVEAPQRKTSSTTGTVSTTAFRCQCYKNVFTLIK